MCSSRPVIQQLLVGDIDEQHLVELFITRLSLH